MQKRDNDFYYNKNKQYFNKIDNTKVDEYLAGIVGDVVIYKDRAWNLFKDFCKTLDYGNMVKSSEWYYKELGENPIDSIEKDIKLNSIKFYLYERLFRKKYPEYVILWDVAFSTLFEKYYLQLSILEGTFDYQTLLVLRMFQLDWYYNPHR